MNSSHPSSSSPQYPSSSSQGFSSSPEYPSSSSDDDDLIATIQSQQQILLGMYDRNNAAMTYCLEIMTTQAINSSHGGSISGIDRERGSGGKMGERTEYWLLKTEPGEWSWEDQSANKGLSKWDGVKNKQAQKNMKAMHVGDLCFFYHSGSRARRVVGVVSVVRGWYGDEESKDGGGAVDVKAVGEMRRAVDLAEMKRDEGLKGFGLFRQPRLSVVPVEKHIWERVCEMGGGYDGDGLGDDDDDDDADDEE